MDLYSISPRWRRVGLILAMGASVAVIAFWYFSTRLPPIPQRTLRIGFESNPPVQIRRENGFSGLAVETVNEAAKRAGIKLEWVETGTSSDEAFGKGLVDLWPLMVDYPYRRKHVHFARPWMHSSNVLLLRDGAPNADRHFKGSIAVFKMPLQVRQAREQFPEAHIVEVPNLEDTIKQACKGTDAGFIEARAAMMLLREKFQECSPMALRVQGIPGLKFDAGVASTFESAGAADRIQAEIDNMFRDGVLAGLIAKYSYFGLDDTWASYEQIEAERRWRWFTGAFVGLVFALGLTLWQASSLKQRKRTEIGLRESEERLRFAQQAASIGTFDWDIETGISRWTPELEAIYGLPRGGFPGTHSAWENLVHPDDRALSVQKEKEAFETGMPVEAEWRTILLDGRVRWIFGRWQVFKNAAGKPLRMMGVNMDVTDRKYVEEALRQSEERFRLAIQATNDAVWDIDLVAGTVSWNETYATLYGRPPETSKSWQWWIDRIHPEDRERTSGGLRTAISGSESTWTGEYRFQRVDGAWAYIHDRAYIARDPSGSAWRVIGAMQDLTERKRAEDELRESQQRLVSIYNTVEDIIFHLAIEPEGQFRIVSVNAAFLRVTGLSQEEVVGKTVNQVIPEPSLTMVLGKYRQAIEEGTVVRWEEISDYPTGRLTGEVSVAPVLDNTGTCTHLVGSVHDITEIKRAQEIENRLTSELAASRDEIRALAARLLTVQEEERRSLSRELHDRVCQNLVGLAMEVATLATKPLPPKEAQTRLKAIQANMFQAAEEARDLAYQVHSPIIDELGLIIALEDLHRKFSEQHPDIPVDLKNAGLPAVVPREVASCVFRVAQESLQNIAKHSNAKNVSVALGFENGAVVLRIGDDGVGFDLRAVKARKGLGLIGMDERARLVKGKLTITAQPAHGAQITLEIPLDVGNS